LSEATELGFVPESSKGCEQILKKVEREARRTDVLTGAAVHARRTFDIRTDRD
jgi:hypothetical protein